jgi:hypothetical protein
MVEAVLDPRKAFASTPALLYGIILIMDAVDTSFWLVIATLVVLGLILLAGALEYPVAALVPAFAGVFLLSACAVVFLQGVPDNGTFPITGTTAELWVCSLIAGVYIIWGVYTTRKALIG